jgi:hypothetical protein
MGYSQLALSTAGTVNWNNAKLRVALALDVSGFNVVERKMTALKTAARRRSTHPQLTCNNINAAGITL